MMMDYIALAGFIMSVFVAGIAVGKLVEKIEVLAVHVLRNRKRLNIW